MRTITLLLTVAVLGGCVGGGSDWRDGEVLTSEPPPALRALPGEKAWRANGEICTADADCSTGFCGPQPETGERRCYGSKKGNEPCLSTFDCAVGVCAPAEWPQSAGGRRVCVAATESCSKPEVGSLCAELARVQCAFFRACGLPVPNLSQCAAAGCDDIAARSETDDAVDCEGRLRGLAAAGIDSCPR